MEKKKHWKTKTAKKSAERISHSPDHADSLAMCFYNDIDEASVPFADMAYNDLEMIRR